MFMYRSLTRSLSDYYKLFLNNQVTGPHRLGYSIWGIQCTYTFNWFKSSRDTHWKRQVWHQLSFAYSLEIKGKSVSNELRKENVVCSEGNQNTPLWHENILSRGIQILRSLTCIKTASPKHSIVVRNQGRLTHHWRLEISTTIKQTLSENYHTFHLFSQEPIYLF